MRSKVKYLIILTWLLLGLLLLLKIKYLVSLIQTKKKKPDCNTKINEIEMKIIDHNHDKYITTPEFNKLTAESFAARLKQANLASKSDIANFVNKTDFDNKLKDVTSNKNELNELSKKVKAISTKGLTKDLINKFSILNGAKYFSSGIFEIYLVSNTLNIFMTLLKFIRENLIECQKKVLKI